MPPKAEITKEKILSTAFDMVREQGFDILTARNIARRLKCSTQPIYSTYGNMEEVKDDVFNRAIHFAIANMKQYKDVKNSPAMHLALGYLLFAQNEKQLFRMIFLSEYRKIFLSKHNDKLHEEMYTAFLQLDPRLSTISENKTKKIHMKLSTYMLGIGTMINTDMLKLEMNEATEMLEEMYQLLTMNENLV